jgi:hypothetical protein
VKTTTPMKVPKGLEGLSAALIEKVRRRQQEAGKAGLGKGGANAEIIKQRCVYVCLYTCVECGVVCVHLDCELFDGKRGLARGTGS